MDPLVRYFQNVEPDILLACAHQKRARDIDIAFSLMKIHRFRRSAECIALPRFHLAKNHRIAVARHNVRFSERRFVICL